MDHFDTRKHKEIRSLKSKSKLLRKILLGAFTLHFGVFSLQQTSLGREKEVCFLEEQFSPGMTPNSFNSYLEAAIPHLNREKIDSTSSQQSAEGSDNSFWSALDDFLDFPSMAKDLETVGGNFAPLFIAADIQSHIRAGLALSLKADRSQLFVKGEQEKFFKVAAALDTATLLVDPKAREELKERSYKTIETFQRKFTDKQASTDTGNSTNKPSWSDCFIALNEFLNSAKDKIASVQDVVAALLSPLSKFLETVFSSLSGGVYMVTDLSNFLVTLTDPEKALQRLKEVFEENKQDAFYPILGSLRGFLTAYKISGLLLPNEATFNESLFRESWVVHQVYLWVSNYLPFLRGPQLGVIIGDLVTQAFKIVSLSFLSPPEPMRIENIASAYGFLLGAVDSDFSFTVLKGMAVGTLTAKYAASVIEKTCGATLNPDPVWCEIVPIVLPTVGGLLGGFVGFVMKDEPALATENGDMFFHRSGTAMATSLHGLQGCALPKLNGWSGFRGEKQTLLTLSSHFEKVIGKIVEANKTLFGTQASLGVATPKKHELKKSRK